MNTVRWALPPLLFLAASGCSVFESTPVPENTRERDYLATEYGDAAPQALMSVQINDQRGEFHVWLGTKHSRIMVEATPATAEATKGTASKLTLGFVDRPLDQAPYREAAIRYLADSGRTGCELKSGGQIAPNRFEWVFNCAQSPATPASAGGATKPKQPR